MSAVGDEPKKSQGEFFSAPPQEADLARSGLHFCCGPTVKSEMVRVADRPVVRVVAMAVLTNPFTGRYVKDLTELFEAGRMIGEELMPDLVRQLPQLPVSYGKGAIVGVDGEFEHGGACIQQHDTLSAAILRRCSFRSIQSSP